MRERGRERGREGEEGKRKEEKKGRKGREEVIVFVDLFATWHTH